MPFNYLGDLHKYEIVERLKSLGCKVNSVHALNLILEEMGILEHQGNSWLTTEKGVKYTIYRGKVYDADGWHPSIVQEIYRYLTR